MNFDSVAELLDYIVNELPSDSEGVTFDLDDNNKGVTYVTTNTKNFKITITEEV